MKFVWILRYKSDERATAFEQFPCDVECMCVGLQLQFGWLRSRPLLV